MVDPAATNPHHRGDHCPDPDQTYATSAIISKNRPKGLPTPPPGHVLHADRPSPQRQPESGEKSPRVRTPKALKVAENWELLNLEFLDISFTFKLLQACSS